jgi:hypothetical protein
MVDRPKFLHLLGEEANTARSVRYSATLMAYGEGGENKFEFNGPPELMEQPADDVIDVFINAMNERGLTKVPFRYELNGAIKHGKVLTAMGSLLHKGRAFPFIAMIAPTE